MGPRPQSSTVEAHSFESQKAQDRSPQTSAHRMLVPTSKAEVQGSKSRVRGLRSKVRKPEAPCSRSREPRARSRSLMCRRLLRSQPRVRPHEQLVELVLRGWLVTDHCSDECPDES